MPIKVSLRRLMVSAVLEVASAVLETIRPVLQNLLAELGSVDPASQVDQEVAEASLPSPLAQEENFDTSSLSRRVARCSTPLRSV